MFEQLLAHLWGDYILQSDWMAQNKTKQWFPAICHAVMYSLLFLLFQPSLIAFTVILGSHLLIDRFRLVRYVVWAKNWMGMPQPFCVERTESGVGEVMEATDINPPWRFCKATGYPPTCPAWLTVWLLIIADNTLHLTINYAALRWL